MMDQLVGHIGHAAMLIVAQPGVGVAAVMNTIELTLAIVMEGGGLAVGVGYSLGRIHVLTYLFYAEQALFFDFS